ncbi:MAG: hypothetical protein QM635_08270 [Microbacteriaceae bacterium]
MLFGLISVSVIPVFIDGARLSACNTTVATAAQLASRDIEQARVAGGELASASTSTSASIRIPVTS